jgi:hypothetical protein
MFCFRSWVNQVAAKETREAERVQQLLKSTDDLEKYLREERLNAIKHVLKHPFLNPDDPGHHRSISVDLRLIKDFARIAIEQRALADVI